MPVFMVANLIWEYLDCSIIEDFGNSFVVITTYISPYSAVLVFVSHWLLPGTLFVGDYGASMQY